MPGSMPRQVPMLVDQLWRLYPHRILEIGCGFGLHGVAAREYLDVWHESVPYGEHRVRIDTIEIFEPYITNVHRTIYDTIMIGDACDILPVIEPNSYDLIIMLDVLEHIERGRGATLMGECRRVSKNTLIGVPYPPGPQGTVFGNVYESHISSWEEEDFAPCELIEKTDALVVLL